MNLIFLILLPLVWSTTQPSIRKSVSFHESVDDDVSSRRAREISAHSGKSFFVNMHEQLVSALHDLGLLQLSEDQFETMYIGFMDTFLKGESPMATLDPAGVIDKVVSGALFHKNEEIPQIFLPLDELLDLLSQNMETIPDETRTKFRDAVRERYIEMCASDQRTIHSLYGNILSQIEL
jgi:hypothetical protein